MPRKDFEPASIFEMDNGRIAEAFKLELDHILRDIRDRPHEKKARSLAVVCEMVPVPDDIGDLEGATLKIQIKSSVPKRQSRAYSLGVGRNGLTYIEDEGPEQPLLAGLEESTEGGDE